MVVLVQAAAPGQIKGLEVGSAPGQEREREKGERQFIFLNG
jgi:hypothetical protein